MNRAGKKKDAVPAPERKRAEEALRTLSARQEAILAAVPDVIMEVDNHRVYTWASQAGLAFFGADVVGKEAALYFEGEQTTYAAVQPLFDGGRDVVYVESWQRRQDGEKRLLAWWCRVLKDGSGKVTGALSSGRDITARKQTEEALQESEQKYRELVENANSIILRWTHDGTITFLNEFGQKFFGYSEAEILGRHVVGTIVPVRESTSRDLRPLMDHIGAHPEAFAQSINENMRRNGERVWVAWTNKLVLDKQGQAKEILSIGSDITERKRAEEALRESQAFYHSLVAQLPAGVFRKDREGRYVFVSPWFCRLKGLKEEEFLGKTPQEVAASEAAKPDATEQAIKYSADGMDHHVLIMQTGNPIELVEEYTDAAGRKQFVHALKIPVLSSEGKVIGTQGILFDITALKRSEEALRLEQALFDSLVRTIPDHIYFKDRKSRFVRINDAQAKRFGVRSPDEAVGKTDFDFFSEEHARQAYDDEQRIMSTGDPLIGLVEKETWPDGHVTWVSTTKVPLRDADGNITGLVGISRDITERKRAEDGVRMSESLLRATLESTADGILVVGTDGNVLDFNKQFGEMWRLPESVLGTRQDQKLLDCVREQLADPEDFLGKVRELYAQPAKESFDTLQFKDGRVFERFSHPQRLGDRIVGRVWSFRDVTKRKQTEARNREQAALLDNANDAIYVTTLDCTILFWNRGAERTYGWTSAETANRKTTELVSPDVDAIAVLIKTLLERGSWSGERWQMTKSGRKVKVFSRMTLVRDEQGQPYSVFAINTDITEKKQLEAQFLRSQRLESIGALASGIAHDLNNVLTPILMGAPLLREAVQTEAARDMVAAIETSAARGADIVKQVLTFARGVPGERVPLQPRHLIREMVKIAGETFPKNIRIETAAPENLWPIQGDATQMHQALMNLCVNARDAMPAGGVLRLTAENVMLDEAFAHMTPEAKPGPHVCLGVADTGTGIPSEHLDKLFDPFFTTKAPGQGTGLGLSTVLGIARSHGGFVKVRTEVGEGTTFELYLPASPTTEVTTGPAAGSAPPWGHGELILVVDDEEAIREVTRKVLETSGYTVMTAAEGLEAIGIFGRHHRDIQAVITDMMMPGMDGPSLVGALRAIEPGVRIIGISGVGERTGVTNLQALALPAFLAKPFPINKLLTALHGVLHPPASPASV